MASASSETRPRPNGLKNFFQIHRFIHRLHYIRPRALLAVEKLIHQRRRSRERHCLVTTTAQHQQKHHQQWPMQRVLHQYLDAINACGTAESPEKVKPMERHSDGVLRPLFSRLLCVPARSAPVERVFSQSGLIVRPNRAKMSNSLLESLVFLKYN